MKLLCYTCALLSLLIAVEGFCEVYEEPTVNEDDLKNAYCVIRGERVDLGDSYVFDDCIKCECGLNITTCCGVKDNTGVVEGEEAGSSLSDCALLMCGDQRYFVKNNDNTTNCCTGEEIPVCRGPNNKKINKKVGKDLKKALRVQKKAKKALEKAKKEQREAEKELKEAIRAEKEAAKDAREAEKEAKKAANEEKKAEKDAKKAAKEERKAEKEAKRAEKEAKKAAKEEKKAHREAKKAEKEAKKAAEEKVKVKNN